MSAESTVSARRHRGHSSNKREANDKGELIVELSFAEEINSWKDLVDQVVAQTAESLHQNGWKIDSGKEIVIDFAGVESLSEVIRRIVTATAKGAEPMVLWPFGPQGLIGTPTNKDITGG